MFQDQMRPKEMEPEPVLPTIARGDLPNAQLPPNQQGISMKALTATSQPAMLCGCWRFSPPSEHMPYR